MYPTPFQNKQVEDFEDSLDITSLEKTITEEEIKEAEKLFNSMSSVPRKKVLNEFSIENLEKNVTEEEQQKSAELFSKGLVESTRRNKPLSDIAETRKIRYGARQEMTVLGNLYQMARAHFTQESHENFNDALKRVEKERQSKIFQEFPDFYGKEEDGYVLTGRFGQAIFDPAYFAIPWLRIAQASRMASVGLSGTVSAADYALRDKVLYGHVDKNFLAASFALGAAGGYIGDAASQFLKPTRSVRGVAGEKVSRDFSNSGAGYQQLLDFGQEALEDAAPIVRRMKNTDNDLTNLLVQKNNLKKQLQEAIELSNQTIAKKAGQLDLFPDIKDVDIKPKTPKKTDKLTEIQSLKQQISAVDSEMSKLRLNKSIEERGVIGLYTFLQGVSNGTFSNQNWGKSKALAQALIQETIRPVAYGTSGGITGLYLADDTVYKEDNETATNLFLMGAAAGFLHKRVLNYKGGRLSPDIKTKFKMANRAIRQKFANTILEEVDKTYRKSFRYTVGKWILPATTQSARLSIENSIIQKFGYQMLRSQGSKLGAEQVVKESVEEMSDQVFQNFSFSLLKIFANLDDETILATGRLVQNRNLPPNSKFNFLEAGDLQNEKALEAFRKYIVLDNKFKNYIKDTGLTFKEENNYGLTQLFGNKIKDDDEILDKLTEAFKIQYKNNKIEIDKKLAKTGKVLDTQEKIDKWAANSARGYFSGADPVKRELALTVESLLKDSNPSAFLNSKKTSLGKTKTLISTSRFLENERVLFDQEARAFAKDLFVQNPFETTMTLYKNIIPIAEFAKVFGAKGEGINTLRKELLKYYKSKNILKDGSPLPWNKSNPAYHAYTKNLKQLADTINAHFKVLHIDTANLDKQWLINTAQTFQAITSSVNLTKVAVPSMGDILQTIQNSGYRSAWESLMLQIKENSIQKGINVLKPSSALNPVERMLRQNKNREVWKGAKYGSNGTMESVLSDTTQNLTGKGTYQENLYLAQKAFFEIVQLGRITRFSREFAYDAGAYRGYDLARKYVEKGRLSKSERRELSYLGMDLEDAKKVGSYNSMNDAFNDFETKGFIEKAGQRSADRDALIPQLGNRRLFSSSNDPIIRSFGTFLSWAQAKAAQTSALLSRIEDGDVQLGIRALSILPIYAAVRQLALYVTSSDEYRQDYALELRKDSNGVYEFKDVYDARSFLKEFSDVYLFTGQAAPWYIDKATKMYESKLKGFRSEGLLEDINPVVGTAYDIYTIKDAAGFWSGLIELAETTVPFAKDVVRAKKGDILHTLTLNKFLDEDLNMSLKEQAIIKDYQNFQRSPNFEGGLQIRNAVDNPKNRINPYTGEPYAVTAGSSLLDILERRNLLNTTPRMPFGVGSLVSSLLKPKQNDFLVGQIDKAVSKFDDMLKEKSWSVGDAKANKKFKLKTDEVVEEGQLIDARRNLNSRSKDKTSKVMEHPIEAARPKINTIHKSGGKNRFGQGKAATYDTAVVTQGSNELGVDQVLRHEIATEAISKTPMAAVRGKYTSKILTPEDLKADDLREILKRASTVFGFNPKMFNTFVDFESGLAIKSFNGIAVTLDTQVFAILKNPTKFKDVVIDDKIVRLYDDIEYYTPETIPKYQDAFNALSKTQQQTHTKTLQNAKIALDDAGLFKTAKTVPTDILNKFKASLFEESNVKGLPSLSERSMDILEEVNLRGGAQIDNLGNMTLYHRTTPEAAKKIKETGVMTGKEDRLFFSTKPSGEISGYGSEVVEVKVPINNLQLNDIFDNEVHLTLKTDFKPTKVQVVEYNKGGLVNRLQQRNMYG